MADFGGLVKLETATRLLSEVRTVDDAAKVVNLAAAAGVWAKRAKLGLEAQNYAAEIKLRAERKAGELLGKLERGKPPGKAVPSNVGRNSDYRTALTDASATRQDASRWQQVAAIPTKKFEGWLTESKNERCELSTHGLLREVGREVRREERTENLAEISKNDMRLDGSIGSFPILYADPPWRYEHVETESRAIENQYPTMALDEICALPAADVATSDAVLFLWSTSPKLAEAMRVIEAWGFTYRTCAVWVKDKIGMGYYYRQRHELLLVATCGNPPTPAPADRPDSVIEAPRGKHSSKPVAFAETIERMYPTLPKLELFSREPREGWKAWGNQS
jgi:N6-adenosine-specific RNA methylase IME4